MPHKLSDADGEEAKKQASERAPFGPGFPEPVVAMTVRLEVWGSSFKDDGGDWCEFRAFDAQGKSLATRRIDGY